MYLFLESFSQHVIMFMSILFDSSPQFRDNLTRLISSSVWNLSGNTDGYPVIGEFKFNVSDIVPGVDGLYVTAGNITGLPGVPPKPFYNTGTFSLEGDKFYTTTTEGDQSVYDVEKLTRDSIVLSNPTIYTLTRQEK